MSECTQNEFFHMSLGAGIATAVIGIAVAFVAYAFIKYCLS